MEAEPALTPRRGEPEERGDERAGAGRTDSGAGTRQRALPPHRAALAVTALTRTSCSGERSVRPLPGALWVPGQRWLVAACASCGSPGPQCTGPPAPASGRSLQLT